MKLDNKGFAFSTLLYGILAVIIVILMVIFALYSGAEDRSYYYASITEDNLNRCVEQEITLENCYATGAVNCDTKPYYSCLGIDDKVLTGKKVNFKDKLLTKVVTSGEGLTKLTNSNLAYAYKGNTVNNYVLYSGNVWRIIGITSSGEIKIGLFKTNGSVKWDNANGSEWSTSSLNFYLNNEFYDNLSDTQLIDKHSFDIGRFTIEIKDGSGNIIEAGIPYNYDSIMTNEKNAQYSANVGLPNISDVASCTTNNACRTTIIGNTNCSSWITTTETWLISAAQSNAHKAYYIKSGNTVQGAAITSTHNYVPVVYLAPSSEIFEGAGDGSSGSPYVIGI